MLFRSFFVLLLAAVALNAEARQRSYDVTVTNLTRGQVFSPIFVVTHRSSISLFEAGAAASAELAALAEGGETGPLGALLGGLGGVTATATSDGPVPPGESATVRVSGNFRDVVSVASMLVNTNDAFLAVNGVGLPRYLRRVDAIAYDAGSEPNDELCADIPGPACGGAGTSADEGGEGYVFVHSGVHGVGELEPAVYDWRNPVARVTIRRVH